MGVIPTIPTSSGTSSDQTVDEDLSKLKNKINEDKTEPPKKSSYRSKKAKLEQEEKEAREFSQSMAGIGSMLMNMIVERMPTPKPLTAMETQSIDWAFEKVAYKYMHRIGEWKEEVALLGAIGMVLVSRIDWNKVQPVKQTDEKEDDEN